MHPDKHAVFIICEQQLIRLGIILLVNQQPDLEVIGSANDYQEAMPLLRDCAPKVILLFTDADPTEIPPVIFRLKVASPQARMLVTAEVKDALLIRQFLKVGASGYLLTSAPAEDMFQAIHSLVAGGSYVDPDLIIELALILQSWPAVERWQLSKREEEVLRFVVGGYKSREIAHQLSISSKTVDTHCARGMKKLGLHRRKDVIQYGISHGWLNEGGENSLVAG